jgi:hypothetical protein
MAKDHNPDTQERKGINPNTKQMMKLSRKKYQNSERRARPEKVAYFENTLLIASPKFIVMCFKGLIRCKYKN